LTIQHELDLVPGLPTLLYSLAGPTAALGYSEEAACLLGAADATLESTGLGLQPPDQKDILPIIDSVRQPMGEAAYQRAWQVGYDMTSQQAVTFALEIAPGMKQQ
jgi:hypothetical protein